MRLRERPFGPHHPLGDGRLFDDIGAGDLFGGKARDQAQRQRRSSLAGQDRMAADEHQPEEVVVDLLGGGVEVLLGQLLPALGLAAELAPAESKTARRRSESMKRRLPTVTNHARGRSGIPDTGHCSRAATKAS